MCACRSTRLTAGCTCTSATDGQGFNPEAVGAGHHGLLGMRYRIESLGGTLQLLSAPGRGTLVLARLPRVEPEPEPELPPATVPRRARRTHSLLKSGLPAVLRADSAQADMWGPCLRPDSRPARCAECRPTAATQPGEGHAFPEVHARTVSRPK